MTTKSLKIGSFVIEFNEKSRIQYHVNHCFLMTYELVDPVKTHSILRSLEKRRREVGMSRRTLAGRSRVSLPTVNRILSGQHVGASIENVLAIGEALGMEITCVANTRSEIFREKQAVAKATQLVRLVQGTSALERQGLDKDELEDMIKRTSRELSLTKRRLWEE